MIFTRKKMMKAYRVIRCAVVLTAVFSLSACLMRPAAIDRVASSALVRLPENVSQVLLVTDEGLLFFTAGKVHALEKRDFVWRETMAPMDAVIGRNGFAKSGEKREGDGRTPSGIYRLGTAFGYGQSLITKMPYRQAGADDLWVDDPNAPDYNQWVRQEETRAASYEKMRRDDDLYKYGLVIEYNTRPVIRDFGSAIFFHIWSGPGSTTAGCVAVSEENILKILAWLDPALNPVIYINP